MKRKTKKRLARLIVFGFFLLIVVAIVLVGMLLIRWIGAANQGGTATTTTVTIASTETTASTTTTTTAAPTTTTTKTAKATTATSAKSTTASTKTTATTASGDTTAWNLVLVNPWNYLPENFTVKLKTLKNGHAVDERAYPELQEMMDAMRDEGLSPRICSSYRTQKKQESLYKKKINRLMKQGYNRENAETEAGRWVAIPGTSEHQLGLAVDIVDESYQGLDEKQEKTATQQWLMKHSYEYGFILRYPTDKSAITGIGYEPWHYRYVGKTAAKEIYNAGICLEEYLNQQ